jgi:two-component system response regulator MprA
MDARAPAHILLVEDDLRSARVLARMLREDGFEVELVTDGAVAIGRLGRSPIPDMLVTDLRLPHIDGLAIARYARSRRPGMPVIIATGYPQEVARAEKMDPPPVVFTKPLDYAALIEALRGILEAEAGAARAC